MRSVALRQLFALDVINRFAIDTTYTGPPLHLHSWNLPVRIRLFRAEPGISRSKWDPHETRESSVPMIDSIMQ